MFFDNVYKGYNDFWRYLLTVLTTLVALLFIGPIPFYLVSARIYQEGNLAPEIWDAFQNNPKPSLIGMNPNLGLFVLLLSFVTALLVLIFCVKKNGIAVLLFLLNYYISIAI